MQNIKKNIVAITLLLCTHIAMGYNLKFSNVTERFLVICYKQESLSQEYYQIIPPDQSVSHYIPNAHCFGQSILWAELKDTDSFGRELPFSGGIDLVNPENGEIEQGDMQELFKKHLSHKYAFIPMQIKVVDNETFQMTVDAAQELMQGIDALSCQTIKTVAQFMSPVPSLTPSTEATPQDTTESQSTKTKIFKQAFNFLTSPSDETKTNETDKPSPAQQKSSCRFGLGQIAKAGGDLAGVSLCRDLHFVLLDTGEVGSPTSTQKGIRVSRVKKPILIAEINQGG